MVVDESVDHACRSEQAGEVADIDVDGTVGAERIAVVERGLAERQDVGAPDGVELRCHSLLRQAAGVAGDAAQPVVDRIGQDLRLPGNGSLVSYCETVMRMLEFKKKEGAATVAKALADDDAWVLKTTATWDWRRALIENRPAMRELLQLYASKGR